MKYEKLLNDSYNGEKFETLKDGKVLLELERRFLEHSDKDRMLQLMDCLTDSLLLVPMNAIISEKNAEIMKNTKTGDEFSLEDDLRFTPDYLQDSNGKLFIPIFSQKEQVDEKYLRNFSTLWMHISEVIELYKHPRKKLEGIVLDPQTNQIIFSEELINVIEDIMEFKEKGLKSKAGNNE